LPEPALVDDAVPDARSGLANSGAAVSLRGVTKRFGDVTAVAGVDLDIAEGEFFSMLGPSGSGKTTMLRMIAGFELPSDGTVLLKGRDVTRLPPFDRDVNTVFQDYALFPHMSVAQNIAYGLRVRRVPRVERTRRVEEALASVRLDDFGSRRPHQLSGGQRQRVALARALVNRPAVLLLDEPLGALDLKLREEMQVELKAIQQQVGITFIFVTHDQQEALTMSDRIAVFADGRIEQVGTPSEIYERPRTRFVAGFVGTSNVLSPDVARALVGRDETSTIRPEHIRLLTAGAEPAAGEMHTTAVVRDVQYLGAFVRVRAETDSGARLVVDVPSATGLDADTVPGHRCTLSWRAEHVRAVGDVSSTNTRGEA
jgi:putative spermidine/putrescine transport system ATP-binding protein